MCLSASYAAAPNRSRSPGRVGCSILFFDWWICDISCLLIGRCVSPRCAAGPYLDGKRTCPCHVSVRSACPCLCLRVAMNIHGICTYMAFPYPLGTPPSPPFLPLFLSFPVLLWVPSCPSPSGHTIPSIWENYTQQGKGRGRGTGTGR